MKERIHEQITQELKQATRMDMVIVIVAIVVSFVLFCLAMGFAFNSTGLNYNIMSGSPTRDFSTYATIIMFVSLAVIIVINGFSVRALLKNKKQRAALNEGLAKLYKDEGVDQYYDGSIFKGYETRYNLFAVMLIAVGAVSVIAPLVIFINQLIEL